MLRDLVSMHRDMGAVAPRAPKTPEELAMQALDSERTDCVARESVRPVNMLGMLGGLGLGYGMGFLAPKTWRNRFLPMLLLGLSGVAYDQAKVDRFCTECYERSLAEKKKLGLPDTPSMFNPTPSTPNPPTPSTHQKT